MPEGNGFHPRFQRLRKVVQAKLTDRRRRVNSRLRQLGENPVQTNDETVRELNGEITKLKRNLAVACKALGRPLTRPPTVAEFRAEAWLSREAGTSWATNEMKFEHKVASIAGTGETVRILACDLEAIDLRSLNGTKMLAGAPGAQVAPVVISLTFLALDVSCDDRAHVSVAIADDGVPATFVLCPAGADMSSTGRGFRDMDAVVRALRNSETAHTISFWGRNNRRKVFSSLVPELQLLGREHPTIAGEFELCNRNLGHDGEHAALRDACVKLKELNHPAFRIGDENDMKTWIGEKCRGGESGVVPFASAWRTSSDVPGLEGFKGSSDCRAIVASWGPGVKDSDQYKTGLGEFLAVMTPPMNLGFVLKELGDFNKKLTDHEKRAYDIPLVLNDDPPGTTVTSATWNLLEGKDRDGVPYLPENPAMLSIPPHIKCVREAVGSREHLMKLAFRDFAAGAHICYNDAVFTADCYALYLSRKFDRELRA